MASVTITRDEWLEALGDSVRKIEQDAMTVAEVAQKYGISRPSAYRRLRELVANGRARETWKQSSQSRRVVPAYKLVKP